MRPLGRSAAKGRSQGWRRVGARVARWRPRFWRWRRNYPQAGALFSCSFLVFFLFLRSENVRQNNGLQGGRATVLWSSATDLWFRTYRFMVICYRNMVPSTGTRPCCYRFMVSSLRHPAGGHSATNLWSPTRPGLLLQIYGCVRPGGFCYRFMVAGATA